MKVCIVTPAGHLVEASRTIQDAIAAGSKPDLKPGFRYATEADHESARARAEGKKPAPAGK